MQVGFGGSGETRRGVVATTVRKHRKICDKFSALLFENTSISTPWICLNIVCSLGYLIKLVLPTI